MATLYNDYTSDIGNEYDEWIGLVTILAQPKISPVFYSRGRKFSEFRARIMVEAYERGMSQTEIARAFNVSQAWVSQAVRGRQKRRRVRQR
jgi:hypothetical protein